MNINQLKLYLLTNIKDQPISQYINFIEQAIYGGVTMVQLREKYNSYSEIKVKALALQKLLRPLNIPLIINDHVELAAEIDAEGVHLGNEDMSVIYAREILGKDKIIGVSVESMEDLERANNLPINYIAVSAIYQSKTKLNCKKLWGIEGLKQVVDKSIYPVVAIGGIELKHVREIMLAKAEGIALISAISDAENTYQITKEFCKEIES